ncbi:MAG: peptide chain release factor N(5)-glutamine methyltransferase [Candidatus Gracilibacteria bacterium]|jgi:release factor glutamine methyltransferase
MTRGQLLDLGVNVLGQHDTSILDAEVLLCYVLGETKEYLFAHANDEVGDEALEKLYIKYLVRVKDGEPVAYVTGEKEFYGLNFLVNKNVLVPRPETEMLVAKVLSFMRENFEEHGRFRVLDVGTGSGNIAVAIAKNSGHNGGEMIEYVDAIDVSDEALEVALENVFQHGVDDKVKVFNSDLLAGIDEDEQYHIIVANLPYIGNVRNNFVEKNVKDHEPNGALFSGDDGLDLYKKLFQQITERDMDWKIIVGEFGFGQREDLEKLLNKYFEQKWVIEKDLAGIDRMFVVFN